MSWSRKAEQTAVEAKVRGGHWGFGSTFSTAYLRGDQRDEQAYLRKFIAHVLPVNFSDKTIIQTSYHGVTTLLLRKLYFVNGKEKLDSKYCALIH